MALPAGGNIALGYDAASRITGLMETGQPAQNFGYDALDCLAIYASGAVAMSDFRATFPKVLLLTVCLVFYALGLVMGSEGRLPEGMPP